MNNNLLPSKEKYPICAIIHPDDLARVTKLKSSLELVCVEIRHDTKVNHYCVAWEQYVRTIQPEDVIFLLYCAKNIEYAK